MSEETAHVSKTNIIDKSYSASISLHEKSPYLGFFWSYFPAFGLTTEKYFVSFRIQSECMNIQTRKTPNMDTFHAVLASVGIFASCFKLREYYFFLEAFRR